MAAERARWARWALRLVSAGCIGAVLLVGIGAPGPRPAASTLPFSSQNLSFTAGDGTRLHASLGWFGTPGPRPLVVEDSPYAPAVSTLAWSGPDYNYVELQWRGTGLSGGSLDATGIRDQEDLSEFLGWACKQSWSDGSIGLYGFSASAIVVYNAMHLPLPCVKAAALMSGTVDLYRDLLYIGGVPSPVVGSAVEGMILAPWFEDLGVRAQREPASIPASVSGFAATPLAVGVNQSEDAFWKERTFQGDADGIPVLADDGFYDVEERGAFHAFSALEGDGKSHLLVMGAHDGFPSGTSPMPQYTAWFDHYLLGVDNGVDSAPAVQALLSDGSREQFLAGNVTPVSGTGWPLPGTTWNDLYLSPAQDTSVRSLNDGTLALAPGAASVAQDYPFVPSEASETDVHSVAAVSGDGLDQAATYLPSLTDMALSAPTSLTYTSPVLTSAVDAVGPVGLDLYASSSAPFTDLVAVVADVWPDGTAYPVASGWLRTQYPGLDTARSLVETGSAGVADVVDPYNEFSWQDDAAAGTTRQYHLEVLPIGNRFAAGHRIRLYILGTPGDMQGAPPALDAVSMGGLTLSRLVLPTLGTSLGAAFGP